LRKGVKKKKKTIHVKGGRGKETLPKKPIENAGGGLSRGPASTGHRSMGGNAFCPGEKKVDGRPVQKRATQEVRPEKKELSLRKAT